MTPAADAAAKPLQYTQFGMHLPALLLPSLPLGTLLSCCGQLQRVQLRTSSFSTAHCRIWTALPAAAPTMEANLLLLFLCCAEGCCTDVRCWLLRNS
jgi:hypothetical protein